jgi:hypothetical protein
MSPTPPTVPAHGTTQGAGQRIDEGKGRIFPCEQCGADLKFGIGQQRLHCEFCGWTKELQLDESARVQEQDFDAMLARLAELRAQGSSEQMHRSEIRCDSCGATVAFAGTITSTECACCGSPIQRENVHDAPHRVPVDGVLPFLVEQQQAQGSLRQWVQSRWFAPNEFRRRGVSGRFNGVYLPFWTFDTMTFNRYSGERGEHYTVTEGSGDQRRTVRKTRWYAASGAFQRFFDDVLVCAATGVPHSLLAALEPWALERCLPFNQQVIAGFVAQTYALPLDAGFREAKGRIEREIEWDVRRRIGGDEQRIHAIHSRHDAVSYKHVLLPVWLMAYRYGETTYRVAINASTGEVQGERPYSATKITLFVLAIAAIVGAVVFLVGR